MQALETECILHRSLQRLLTRNMFLVSFELIPSEMITGATIWSTFQFNAACEESQGSVV